MNKKKCNPFKLMLMDAWYGFIGPVILLSAGIGLMFLQVHVIFSCFLSTKQIPSRYYTDSYGNTSIVEWTEVPTVFSIWCRGICLFELTLLVAWLLYTWYANAKNRCK